MANKKVIDLARTTEPDLSDLLYLVHDPDGAHVDMAITVAALLAQVDTGGGGGGTITSVFGRTTAAIVAATNDYTWAQINKATSSLADIATRSASDLSSGTLPNGRFPAILPAASGVNLVSLNASNLGSGTVPDAQFPATLPAISGANLTALNASNLGSGTVPNGRFPATLPAASGVNLTALNASNLGSGTVPDGRFPATLPAASGANLTSLNGSNIASGTVADGRLSSNVALLTGAQTFTGVKTMLNVPIVGGTITADTPSINASQTWNNSGVVFNAVKVNVTNTASTAPTAGPTGTGTGSRLLTLQVSGVDKFFVRPDGYIYSPGHLMLGSRATDGTGGGFDYHEEGAAAWFPLAVKENITIPNNSNKNYGVYSKLWMSLSADQVKTIGTGFVENVGIAGEVINHEGAKVMSTAGGIFYNGEANLNGVVTGALNWGIHVSTEARYAQSIRGIENLVSLNNQSGETIASVQGYLTNVLMKSTGTATLLQAMSTTVGADAAAVITSCAEWIGQTKVSGAAIGSSTGINLLGVFNGTGTITTRRALRVRKQVGTSGTLYTGTIQDLVGIEIEDQSGVATATNYNIKSLGDGVNLFEGGVTLKQVAGAVSDASYTYAPPNGTVALDSTNKKIYIKFGGAWYSTPALT